MNKFISRLTIIVCFFLMNQLEGQETFDTTPKAYDLLKSLSNSKLTDGRVLLFTTTHEDIAWLNEPEICKIDRDKLWLTPYMDRLKSEPDFKMDIEQSSIVMEYLHRHPEEKEIFISFLKAGRITIGGAFVQTYEGMYSGESLARQFYFGKKWMKDNLDGYNSNVYFNNDVPSRTMQMPQLASKAGVNNFVFARHIKGLFNWESPDGSKVVCYSPGNHYMEFYNLLGQPDSIAVKRMATDAIDWYSEYNDKVTENGVMPAMLNYEFIWDQKPVYNQVPFTNMWNSISHITKEGKKRIKVNLPEFEYATAANFFKEALKKTTVEKTIKGERPNTWVYIHGAGHQKALKASREGDILMTKAEKFATANALIDDSFKKYPNQELYNAWESKIYPDHGWGGKGGDVTDNLFLQKFLFSKSEAEKLLDESLKSIAGKISFDKEKGSPIVVFNSLSWERSDPVNFKMNFEPGEVKNIQLTTEKGDNVPIQLSESKYYPNGYLQSIDVHFVAENLPSIGFRTFYLKPSTELEKRPDENDNGIFENVFYKVKFGDGGLESIYDKFLQKELINSKSFKAGEIFAMNSEGNGAGEFAEVQQPDDSFFDRLGTGKTDWQLMDNGPLYTSYKMRQNMKEAVIEMKITFHNTIKKIDFDVNLLNWDGVMFREFRMAMPLNINNGQVTYEVPFGAVTVGKDELKGTGGEFYNTPVKEIHPREIENWISASNSDFGVTLSSSVVTADWINPIDSLSTQTILQPILLASRKSCHWEGNDYHQTGDHHFNFSLTSHSSGWKNGQRFGKQANEKPNVLVYPETYNQTSLPEKLSFFSVDKPNVVISAIKKAEDDQSVIIRAYETNGDDVPVMFSIFKPITKAFSTNLIEEPIKEINIDSQSINLNMGHYSIETIKFQ